MSDYEDLVERCAKRYCTILAKDDYGENSSAMVDAAWKRHKEDPARDEFCAMIRDILAEVFRTLEKPTYEMLAVSENDQPEWNWLAMLRASPLAPDDPS